MVGCAALALSLPAQISRAQETVPPITVEASGVGSVREDLRADSIKNVARVAPSSRIHTQTFTRNEISELNAPDVFSLLSNATGVSITTQGRKWPNNVRLRGDADFTFIIDGTYLPSSTAGMVLGGLPVSAIEQIDIIRDPTALTLGPTANFLSPSGGLNAGFIVIHTRKPQKKEGEASIAVEQYGTVKSSAYAGMPWTEPGGGSAKGFASAFVSANKTDGPSGYNAWSNVRTAVMRAGVTAGQLETEVEGLYLNDNYGFQRATAGVNTANLVGQKWSYSPITLSLFSSNSNLTWDADNTTSLHLSYLSQSDSNVLGSYSGTPATVNDERSTTAEAHLRHSYRNGGFLAQVGAQYIRFDNPTGQIFYAGYGRSETMASGYVNLEDKFLDDKLTVDVSARLDQHTLIKSIDLYANASNPLNNAKYNYIYDRTLPVAKNYALGTSYEIMPWLIGSARYSYAEQSEMNNALTATASSLPASSQNKFELGLEAPISHWFTPTATMFSTHIDNDKVVSTYVLVNGYSTPVWAAANTQREGFELAAKGDIRSDQWGKTAYRASWTHMTRLKASPVAYPYEKTLSHDLANLSLTQTYKQFSATVSLNYVSEFMSNFSSIDGAYHPVGNFVTIDANGGYTYKIADYETKLSIYGRNLTNNKYQTILGYPAWGSVYGAELKVSF